MGELRRSYEGVRTPARVGLGGSVSTSELLEFLMDQAEARDAVGEELAVVSLVRDLAALPGVRETLVLRSAAPDRATYLRRPDLGRRLAEVRPTPAPCDLAIVVADGLSALAVHRHAVPLLAELLPLPAAWTVGPVTVVSQGRVAIGDEIGERMGAAMVLVLLGERPGLTAPDSLGAYLTWAPRVGRTDAERVCVSNIRPEGTGYAAAARQIDEAMRSARRLGLTGVGLGRAAVLGAGGPAPLPHP